MRNYGTETCTSSRFLAKMTQRYVSEMLKRAHNTPRMSYVCKRGLRRGGRTPVVVEDVRKSSP